MATGNKQLMQKMEAKNGNGNGHTVATSKPKTVADEIRDQLERMKSQMLLALPKHLTADRLGRVALTVIRTNPSLLDPRYVPSLLACVMESAQLGLEPGLLGHVYYVPFGNKVQFIIGYRGMIELARRSGQIKTIGAAAIYSNDKFKFIRGFSQTLEHEPNYQNRGTICGFYAYCTTKDGGQYCEVMTVEEIEKIRSRSKAANNGPWKTDWEAMGCKTVFRRLWKWLPISIELSQAIREDEQKEFGEDVQKIELNLGELPKSEAIEVESQEIHGTTGFELVDTDSDVYGEIAA